jgi:hypothetical protein
LFAGSFRLAAQASSLQGGLQLGLADLSAGGGQKSPSPEAGFVSAIDQLTGKRTGEQVKRSGRGLCRRCLK